jgi:hypothetical protein
MTLINSSFSLVNLFYFRPMIVLKFIFIFFRGDCFDSAKFRFGKAPFFVSNFSRPVRARCVLKHWNVWIFFMQLIFFIAAPTLDANQLAQDIFHIPRLLAPSTLHLSSMLLNLIRAFWKQYSIHWLRHISNANLQSASSLNALPHQQVATPKIRINHTYTVFLGLQLILPVGFH